jgi:hypothetical protein
MLSNLKVDTQVLACSLYWSGMKDTESFSQEEAGECPKIARSAHGSTEERPPQLPHQLHRKMEREAPRMEVTKTFYSVRGFQWHRVMDAEVMQQIAYRLCSYASSN